MHNKPGLSRILEDRRGCLITYSNRLNWFKSINSLVYEVSDTYTINTAIEPPRIHFKMAILNHFITTFWNKFKNTFINLAPELDLT